MSPRAGARPRSAASPLHILPTKPDKALGQAATDETSNEITAIPELLRLVGIRGTIITIDAMGTQTAIAQQIIETQAEDVLALKGHPGTLPQAAIDYADEQREHNLSGIGARRPVTQAQGHGREEKRIDVQRPAPRNLPGLSRWTGLRSMGVAMGCLKNLYQFL